MKGDGNNYTTEFRQLDTRLGRWFSIDPKATPWESPYVSMGNNPIWRNDVFGDIFDEVSKEGIKNHKSNTVNRINSSKNEINKIQNEISQLTKSTNISQEEALSIIDPTGRLGELNQTVNELNSAIIEINELENSNQIYSISKLQSNENSSITGMTYHKNGSVVAEFSNEISLAHELKHMYQFEKGETSFQLKGNGAGYLHDATDEIEAYNRESYYSSNSSVRNMSVEDIISRNNVYTDLPKVSLNYKMSVYDVLIHYKNAQDFILENPQRAKEYNYKNNANVLGDLINKNL